MTNSTLLNSKGFFQKFRSIIPFVFVLLLGAFFITVVNKKSVVVALNDNNEALIVEMKSCLELKSNKQKECFVDLLKQREVKSIEYKEQLDDFDI